MQARISATRPATSLLIPYVIHSTLVSFLSSFFYLISLAIVSRHRVTRISVGSITFAHIDAHSYHYVSEANPAVSLRSIFVLSNVAGTS
jgi:hypothetical protein